MSITILKPGMMSSIQDLGRWGFQRYGIPIGGAMDTLSATTVNRLCGNEDGEAVLECTLHGTELQCNETVSLALGGGGARATINATTVPYNKLIKMVSGSILKLHPDPYGCRTYIAFVGGLRVSKELGSASTYAPAMLGGYEGKNLVAGNTFALKDPSFYKEKTNKIVINENGFGISTSKFNTFALPHVQEITSINCLLGPEWDLFSEESQTKFFNHSFTISAQSNRMGFRMEGAILSLKEKVEMISTAVTRGIVQVTNQGNPIVLMADSQTIGGYPRIARICAADISLLAQCRPGQRLRFSGLRPVEIV